MFPLYDITEKQKIPYVNYLLIILNIIVFGIQIASPDFEDFIHNWGFIPLLFDYTDISSYKYLISSMFLHGSILHLAANLWFLHLFGDNVEDRLGHLAYLMFYLLAGVTATMAQMYFIYWQNIPLIGASGAISGVAGAYLIFQARSKIVSLVPVGFFITTMRLPAWFFLIYWFLLQLVSGFASTTQINYNLGGTAWWAHVGGFLFGVGMALLLRSIMRESRATETA